MKMYRYGALLLGALLTTSCSCKKHKGATNPSFTCQLVVETGEVQVGTPCAVKVVIKGPQGAYQLQHWQVSAPQKGALTPGVTAALTPGEHPLTYTPQTAGKHLLQVVVAQGETKRTARCSLTAVGEQQEEVKEEAETKQAHPVATLLPQAAQIALGTSGVLVLTTHQDYTVKQWHVVRTEEAAEVAGKGSLRTAEGTALAAELPLAKGSTTLHFTPEALGEHVLHLTLGSPGGEEQLQVPLSVVAPQPQYRIRAGLEGNNQVVVEILTTQATLKAARWKVTGTTWSAGLKGKLRAAADLQCGRNVLPCTLSSTTPKAPAVLTIALQGPDQKTNTVQVDVFGPCLEAVRKEVNALQKAARSYAEKENREESYYSNAINEPAQSSNGNYRSASREATQAQAAHATSLARVELRVGQLMHALPLGGTHFPKLIKLQNALFTQKLQLTASQQRTQMRHTIYSIPFRRFNKYG